MDYEPLASLRRHHPAWRLLAADNAPFVIAFLYQCFIRPNVRALSDDELTPKLEDFLFQLRERLADEAPSRAAREYLHDWADNGRGWLRRYYPPSSDEPYFDLTPAAEQAIQWLTTLEQRPFVGAESRLKLVFDLLHQIAEGSETDPRLRLAELTRRRDLIDAEIDQIRAGRLSLMEPTQLRERFLQAIDTARALLADFRQVEQNFRDLDRQVRERITGREGGKGDVLEQLFGERDAIADSDQGRSFRAFWEFLMSAARQEELTRLLERVFMLDSVAELAPDTRLKRIHYDWLNAGEATQRTIARLSEQLRRYLDDQAWFEDRRIMTVLRDLERHALALRETPPPASLMTLDDVSPDVDLPMDRPLFTPPIKPVIAQQILDHGEIDLAADALFEQFFVDKERLRARLRRALQTKRQVSLTELLEDEPLEQGLAEIVAWLSIATGEGRGVIDEHQEQTVTWKDAEGRTRLATMPVVVFVADLTESPGVPTPTLSAFRAPVVEED